MTFEIPKPGMPILLDVGGRKLELRFSLKTLKQMQTDLNVSVLQGEGLTAALRDPEKLVDFLWYGLRGKNPGVTREWVEEEFDASMLMGLVPVLAYAVTGNNISALMPSTAISPNGKPPAEAGLISGPLAAMTSDSASATSGD